MQTRFLIIALAACAVLVLGAFWQMSQPNERTRKYKPGRVSLDAPLDDQQAPLPVEFVPEALEPETLQAPPPAPLLTNDPGRGNVWLRVIDADTNRPLANTDCRLLQAGYQYWGDYAYAEDVKPGYARTDADGLISLTVQVLGDGDETDESAQVVIEPDAEETVTMRMPVPGGYYAADGIWELGEKLYELTRKPLTTPIDVMVRQLASVRITARDRYGMPIPDAYLSATLLDSNYEHSDWLERFCPDHDTEDLGEWKAEADELRRVIRRDQLTCMRVGAPIEHDPEDIPWYSEDAAAADQFGTLSFRHLPCMGVGVLAWHPRYGTAVGRLNLQSGRNELNVYFREELSCELRIRVNRSGDEEEQSDWLEVEISRSGPYGLSDFIMDGEDWFSRNWDFGGITAGTCELVVAGVPPGCWHVWVGENYYAAGENVELAPGETRVVDLYLGEANQAQWTPIIRSGGVQLSEAALYLLGGEIAQRTHYDIYFDSETGETDHLELPPGNYVAWLPTLEAFRFTLAPGQKRKDEFELKSLNVNITLGLDLAKLLGDPDEGARLDLMPTDMWDDAREHLYALDASMRKLDADYDLLKPGFVRGWMLPPGEYEWQLYGDNSSVEGCITFTEKGPTSLHFGIDSLPGYAALDVTLIGFPLDEPPELAIYEDSLEYFALRPRGRSKRGRLMEDVPSDEVFREQVFDNVVVQVLQISDTRWICFGPPGRMLLNVWDAENDRNFPVKLPSRITVNAHELGMHGFRELQMLEEPEDPEAPPVHPEDWDYDDFDVELSAPGWFERLEYDYECDAPHEAFRVRVVRSRYFNSGASQCEFAEIECAKGTDDVVLELWKLDYRPCATLDLEFKGRGSPDQNFDAWWFHEGGPRAPRLYALDAAGKNPRIVYLSGVNDYMPGGRLEFAVRGLVLPPGKYRLVPWDKAPAKYVQDFALQSGQHTTITVSTE